MELAAGVLDAFDAAFKAAVPVGPASFAAQFSPPPAFYHLTSWYVSPRIFLLEAMCLYLVWVVVGRKALRRGRRTRAHPLRGPANPALVAVRNALHAALAVSFSFIVVYKFVDANFQWRLFRVAYLLQPCHVLTTLLLVLWLRPLSDKLANDLFNVYANLTWGAWLALIFVDLRDYDSALEIWSYWIQHALMLSIPIFDIVAEFRPLYHDWSWVFLTWWGAAVYHLFVLCPFSHAFGININMTVHPGDPPVKALEAFGPYYRMAVTYVFGTIATPAAHGVHRFASRLRPQKAKSG